MIRLIKFSQREKEGFMMLMRCYKRTLKRFSRRPVVTRYPASAHKDTEAVRSCWMKEISSVGYQ